MVSKTIFAALVFVALAVSLAFAQSLVELPGATTDAATSPVAAPDAPIPGRGPVTPVGDAPVPGRGPPTPVGIAPVPGRGPGTPVGDFVPGSSRVGSSQGIADGGFDGSRGIGVGGGGFDGGERFGPPGPGDYRGGPGGRGGYQDQYDQDPFHEASRYTNIGNPEYFVIGVIFEEFMSRSCAKDPEKCFDSPDSYMEARGISFEDVCASKESLTKFAEGVRGEMAALGLPDPKICEQEFENPCPDFEEICSGDSFKVHFGREGKEVEFSCRNPDAITSTCAELIKKELNLDSLVAEQTRFAKERFADIQARCKEGEERMKQEEQRRQQDAERRKQYEGQDGQRPQCRDLKPDEEACRQASGRWYHKTGPGGCPEIACEKYDAGQQQGQQFDCSQIDKHNEEVRRQCPPDKIVYDPSPAGSVCKIGYAKCAAYTGTTTPPTSGSPTAAPAGSGPSPAPTFTPTATPAPTAAPTATSAPTATPASTPTPSPSPVSQGGAPITGYQIAGPAGGQPPSGFGGPAPGPGGFGGPYPGGDFRPPEGQYGRGPGEGDYGRFGQGGPGYPGPQGRPEFGSGGPDFGRGPPESQGGFGGGPGGYPGGFGGGPGGFGGGDYCKLSEQEFVDKQLSFMKPQLERAEREATRGCEHMKRGLVRGCAQKIRHCRGVAACKANYEKAINACKNVDIGKVIAREIGNECKRSDYKRKGGYRHLSALEEAQLKLGSSDRTSGDLVRTALEGATDDSTKIDELTTKATELKQKGGLLAQILGNGDLVAVGSQLREEAKKLNEKAGAMDELAQRFGVGSDEEKVMLAASSALRTEANSKTADAANIETSGKNIVEQLVRTVLGIG